MALRMVENFGIYGRDATKLARRWTSATPAAGGSWAITAGGRNGADVVAFTAGNGGSGYLSRTFDAQATWVVGFAFKVATIPSTATAVLRFLDSTSVHVDVRLNPDGTLTATRNATALGTTAWTIAAGEQSYVEVKVNINDASPGGSVYIRKNGSAATQLALTGIDTRNAGNASANVIQIGNSINSGCIPLFSDLYICDGSATAPNDFLGDVAVDITSPTGSGSSSQFTGSDGDSVNNYLLVDDGTAPDDDTTYVESSTPGQIDLYTYADVAAGSAIKGVEVLTLARKTDAGSRSIRAKTKQGATVRDGATLSLGDTYAYQSEIYPTAPDGTAWDSTKWNALEVGAEEVA